MFACPYTSDTSTCRCRLVGNLLVINSSIHAKSTVAMNIPPIENLRK